MDGLPPKWKLYTPRHDQSSWAGVPAELDLGIHLAGQSDPADSVARPGFDLFSNAGFTVRLLQTFRFKRFIFMSSGAVYDGLAGAVTPQADINPTLPYAISKFAAERYCWHFLRQGQIDNLTIVRFFGAYGPGEPSRKIYSRMVRQFGIECKPEFTVRGDGTNLIDAMYIDDAVRALKRIISIGWNEAVFNLASNDPITITELV
jgi:UDP-glucose 4-epimerase